MICPHCRKEIPDKTIARHLASVGGKAGTGKSKARTNASEAGKLGGLAKARAAKKGKE